MVVSTIRTKSARSALSHRLCSDLDHSMGLTFLDSPIISVTSLGSLVLPSPWGGFWPQRCCRNSLPLNQDFPHSGLSSPAASTRSHNFYNYRHFWIESQGKIKPAWIEMSRDEDTVVLALWEWLLHVGARSKRKWWLHALKRVGEFTQSYLVILGRDENKLQSSW